MAVTCDDCSNPTSGTVTLSYDGANPLACDDTVAQYYSSGGTAYAYEADFLWGACSFFNIPSMIALAQAIQEGGGPGDNWMQLLSTTIDEFASDFMTSTNNQTGVSFNTDDAVSADSINAVVAMWRLRRNLNETSYSGHNALLAALNAYNSGTFSLTYAYERFHKSSRPGR